MTFLSQLEKALQEGLLSQKYYELMKQFYLCYQDTLKQHNIDIEPYEPIFLTFFEKAIEQIKTPFSFKPYHEQILTPFNHYQFGLDFVRPLIDFQHSSVHGHNYLEEIEKKLEQGENVIFLANHQVEADPQAISLLLENRYPKLARELIFVAGERVLTDPLAIPFSMGRNLLCIYSKRYIDHPPELKMKKQIHNKRTMELMSELLCEGGHAIYVAPSGGRDRIDETGFVNVANFDPQSIEMFYLMTQKATKPSSFYPMALYTYDLLPPPATIQLELGEQRVTKRGGIHLAIGPQIFMEEIPGLEDADKRRRREMRAEFIQNQVCKEYEKFPHFQSKKMKNG